MPIVIFNSTPEKGVAGENRGHGTFMPFLGKDGKPLPIKQQSEAKAKAKVLRENAWIAKPKGDKQKY